jgi:hypothetical protein
MITSCAILMLSFVMLLAWLRYTFLLLRDSHRDFALTIIREHGLKFRELHIDQPASAINETLRRDTEILDALLRRVLPAYGFELFLLRVDFTIMQVFWRLTHSRSESCASAALQQMMRVLESRAGLIGLVAANQ